MTSTINVPITSLSIKNQRAVFNDLYDQYGAAFYGEIKKHLYQQEISDQVLITAYKIIWESLHQYDASKESLFLWCFRIVRKEMGKKKVDLLLREIFTCQTFSASMPEQSSR